MITFKQFLDEALIDVDRDDINKIFEPIRKPMKEMADVWTNHFDRLMTAASSSAEAKTAISRSISRELSEVIKKNQPVLGSPIKTIRSSVLKSNTAKTAHEVNPVSIYVWLVCDPRSGNFYFPEGKAIHVGLDYNVYEAMMNIQNIPLHQLAQLRNEVSDLKHKSTIRHELTHWIDDSMHNFYIKKGLAATMGLMRDGKQTPESLKVYKHAVAHGEDDVYNSPVEINAMVNQIAEYKRRVGQKKYDSITWKDLMISLPSLNRLNSIWGAYWRRKMFTRMSRENLIGKNFMKQLD